MHWYLYEHLIWRLVEGVSFLPISDPTLYRATTGTVTGELPRREGVRKAHAMREVEGAEGNLGSGTL